MNSEWIDGDIENDARRALGADLCIVADLFPRAVNSIYVQMMSETIKNQGSINNLEYRSRVLAELPRTCEEVLPFFVRSVWNKHWHPDTHSLLIEKLAKDFTEVVKHAGGLVSSEELFSECVKSFR